jgi:hypothetical protein
VARYGSSTEGYAPNLDLFSLPPTNVGVLSSNYTTFYPTNSYKDGSSPINFNVHSPSDYLDPQSCIIFLELSIKHVTTSGISDLTVAEDVGPVSNLGAAIFSSAEVLINGVPYIRPSPFQAYVSHIQDLLYVNSPVDKPRLKLQIWYPASTPDSYSNIQTNYVTRRDMAALSKKFYCIARIPDPLFLIRIVFYCQTPIYLSH